MADAGYSWGIYPGNPTSTIPYGWDGDRKPSGVDVNPWKRVGTTTDADFSESLGDLRFLEGTYNEFVSPVMNKGNTDSYKIVLVKDETISDGFGIALQYRGQAASFEIDAASPAWEDYPVGGAYKTWQYIQIKTKLIEFLEL